MVRRFPQQMPPEGATVTFNTVPQVVSVADLFALAIAMEHEATERYDALIRDLEAAGEPTLIPLFRELREAEAGHETGIMAWAEREGVAPSRTLSFQWDNPEALTRKDIEEAGGLGVSQWTALAMAVRNEERAFAFYTEIAATTPDMAVREYAERMAKEELEHVAMLRLERRRAWRGEYSADLAALPTAGSPEAAAGDADALAAYVRAVEMESAGRLRGKARLARESLDSVAADLLQEMAEEAEARARAAGAYAPIPEVHVAPGSGAEQMREEELRLSRLYDAYMRLTETSADAAVRDGAQEETAVILSRLSRLRDERARTAAALGGEG